APATVSSAPTRRNVMTPARTAMHRFKTVEFFRRCGHAVRTADGHRIGELWHGGGNAETSRDRERHYNLAHSRLPSSHLLTNADVLHTLLTNPGGISSARQRGRAPIRIGTVRWRCDPRPSFLSHLPRSLGSRACAARNYACWRS